MRILSSTMAVFVGFISVAVLSLGTDQVLHVLEFYPAATSASIATYFRSRATHDGCRDVSSPERR